MLTDDDCQKIREHFSVMKDTSTGIIEILDYLSNKYLGTFGHSSGSWDDTKGCYTGGIFTGCKTSANHEIWERILQVTKFFVYENFGQDLRTWSMPGSKYSQCYFPYNGQFFYDIEHTLHVNNLARFSSSLYNGQNGSPQERSWADVLRENGYDSTHDSWHPGRVDGLSVPCMSYQYIMNASLSRPDALVYSTIANRSVHYKEVAQEFDGIDFGTADTIEAAMYDHEGCFKNALESWRNKTANGIICGEVIDSEDTYSEKVIMEGWLKYCSSVGIDVITKSEAYDICFNHDIEKGNLIYNPKLRNTAKEFLPTAKTVPSNPDGYMGDCIVEEYDNIPVLVTKGTTTYNHFGIPYGRIVYVAQIKGKGSIKVRLIKNNTNIAEIGQAEVIAVREIESPKGFSMYQIAFDILDNAMTSYEQKCAGWGNKIIGIRIEYSPGLQVKEIKMVKL